MFERIASKVLFRLAAVMLLVLAGFTAGARAGTVVIVEGHDARPEVNNGIHEIGSVCAANYAAKGYSVVRFSNQAGPVAKADVIAAINQPGVNAIVFCGHGTQGPPVGTAKGPFTPGLALNGDVIRPGDLTGNYNGILHVEFQSCGQKLPQWDAKFPNAGGIDAWGRKVTVAQALNDAKNGSPARIPMKNPPSVPPPSGIKTGMDPRLESRIMTTPAY